MISIFFLFIYSIVITWSLYWLHSAYCMMQESYAGIPRKLRINYIGFSIVLSGPLGWIIALVYGVASYIENFRLEKMVKTTESYVCKDSVVNDNLSETFKDSKPEKPTFKKI